MRLVISIFILVSAALTAAAQTTTNSACINPQPPADVASPATPSVAAGVMAAANRNFALARANFRPLAENGDPDAQRAMGQLLMQDCTGMQDRTAAIGWLVKAVAGGNVVAENQLGHAYMLGLGVPQDDAKAFALFSQSAAANNAVGEAELGYLYVSGRGVPQDKVQGLQWTVKSGEQGNAVALGNIAHIYLKGEILERDTDRAAYFLALANQRATPVQRNELMATSREIRAAVSIEDLERATKRSQRWSPGAGSLRDVLSDAEDFRRHKK